jgi:hypothetical protein
MLFKDQEKYRIVETTISFEPLDQNLPEEIESIKDQMFENLKSNPQEVYLTLEQLIKKYPSLPILRNWRQVAFNTIHDDEDKIASLILEDYTLFPDYLFTQGAYAQQCLDNNLWQKIPTIFKNKFNLNDLFPERDIFHITEHLLFYSIMGQYHCYNKNYDTAELHFKMISEFDIEHPTIDKLFFTMMKCFPGVFINLFNEEFLKKGRTRKKTKAINGKNKKF